MRRNKLGLIEKIVEILESDILKYLFLILLSLTPVLWFKGRPGTLIDGVDTNFPLNPALWFSRRFFVWQNLNNGGSDFSASVAGTFFHLIQVIPYKIGLSLQGVEIFSLVFWFAVIVFGSWFLAKLLLPKKNIPQLIFVSLYSLNVYLFNSFENVKVTNLSLVASIPWALSILILLRDKRISRIHASFLALLIGILLSGTGINPAYIITFFTVIFIFYVGEILSNISNKGEVGSLTIDFAVTCFSLVIINLYWIVPTFNFILGNISSSNSI